MINVLIKAHEVSPLRGSECSNGWNFIISLSKFVKITVIHAETNQFGTINYKNEISSVKSLKNVNFISVKQPRITKLLSKLNYFLTKSYQGIGIPFIYFFGVYFWELKVYRKVKAMDINSFDLIHNLNHISFREPSFLWKINKPFFWGPTSGIGIIPKSFSKHFDFKFKIYNTLRNLANILQTKFSARILNASSIASKIFYVSNEDKLFFSNYNNNLEYVPDVGVENIKINYKNKKVGGKIKLVWVGRIDKIKCLDIIINCFYLNPILQKNIELSIIGDGILYKHFVNYSIDRKIKNLKWFGKIDRKDVLEEMSKSDILVHTSIKEASATVIIEALTIGLPVICHDAFGMSNIINDKVGFKISYESKSKSIEEISTILKKIIKDKKLIINMSKNIPSHLAQFKYEKLAEKIYKSYENCINSL